MLTGRTSQEKKPPSYRRDRRYDYVASPQAALRLPATRIPTEAVYQSPLHPFNNTRDYRMTISGFLYSQEHPPGFDAPQT